jgi:hypothetical protein
MKNYVGRKIRGFRFEDCTDGVLWNEDMAIYIGEVGECIRQNNDCLRLEFDDTNWGYPISLIEQHLIEEEEPEISGLEALFIVYGGCGTEEEKILYNKCTEIIQKEKKRLQSIYINTKPKYTHAELVEKLGHDFEYEK